MIRAHHLSTNIVLISMNTLKPLTLESIIFIPNRNGYTWLFQVKAIVTCLITRKKSYVMTRNGKFEALAFPTDEMAEWIKEGRLLVIDADNQAEES